MAKEKSTFRNGLFFLVGVFVYSLLFWLSGKNYAHVFGTILTALIGYLIYMLGIQPRPEFKLMKPRDMVYFCIGVVFDSFSGGFPFNILPPF
jgi:hypothetical protein